MAGASALSGLLGNRSKTQTSHTTTTPTFSPEVKGLFDSVVPRIQQMITDPGAGLDGLRTAGRDRINADYANVPELIATKYGRNAQGVSGKAGSAARTAEFQRLSQFGDLEQQILQAALQQQQTGLQAAGSLLSLGRGTSSDSTGTVPGNMAGGAATSGLQTASWLYTLNRLLKGGSGGSLDAGGYDPSGGLG